MLQREREGFSLVEMLIAVALTAILLSGLIAIISYGSSSMSITQARVQLQDEAKDVTNHISTYVLEGNAQVDFFNETNASGKHISYLIVQNEDVKNSGTDAPMGVTASPAPVVTAAPWVTAAPTADPAASPEPTMNPAAKTVVGYSAYVYWVINKKMYFSNVSNIDTNFNAAEFKTGTGSSGIDVEKLVENKKCLLSDYVSSFNCSVDKTVSDAKRSVLHIELNLENDNGKAKFACKKDIVMRNQ